jgi:hypothetical protein
MDLAEVLDIDASRFEDAKAQESKEGDQGGVVHVARGPRSNQESLELEVTKTERWGIRGNSRPPNILGRASVERAVDDAGAEESGHDRELSRCGEGWRTSRREL